MSKTIQPHKKYIHSHPKEREKIYVLKREKETDTKKGYVAYKKRKTDRGEDFSPYKNGENLSRSLKNFLPRPY